MVTTTDERIKEAVRETYGGLARRFVEEPARASCCGPRQNASCCGPSEAAVETTGTAVKLYAVNELAQEAAHP